MAGADSRSPRSGDKLIIGSGLVFTFRKARSHSAGNHQAEDDLNELATYLKEQAKAKGVQAILPSAKFQINSASYPSNHFQLPRYAHTISAEKAYHEQLPVAEYIGDQFCKIEAAGLAHPKGLPAFPAPGRTCAPSAVPPSSSSHHGLRGYGHGGPSPP